MWPESTVVQLSHDGEKRKDTIRIYHVERKFGEGGLATRQQRRKGGPTLKMRATLVFLVDFETLVR